MGLSVATFVSQAVSLRYPVEAVLESVAPIADEIVVNVDDSRRDGTYEEVHRILSKIGRQYPNLGYAGFKSAWDWGAHDQGHEFRRQTDIAISQCHMEWILVVEADEVVHEDDHQEILWLTTLPKEYAGAKFVRLYFWERLDQIRTDWTETHLTRLIRRGRGSSRVESNNCDVDGFVWPVSPEGVPRLFHYSRIGTPEQVARRIWSNDVMHHTPDKLRQPGAYDFGLRKVDSHSVTVRPERVDPSVLVPYDGTHPEPMLRWLERQEAAR